MASDGTLSGRKLSAIATLAGRRPDDTSAEATSRRLGGTTIYAPSKRDLDYGIEALSDIVASVAARNPSLSSRTLRAAVQRSAADGVDERVVRAVIGAQLRLGVLDAIRCAGAKTGVYRCIVSAERLDDFRRRLSAVRRRLSTDGV